jgi:hypothetical protein
MALTKIGKEGITGISNASDATFLTATSGEGVTLAGTLAVTGVHTIGTNAVATSEGGAVTQNLVQGLAKAWIKLTGTGTVAIRDSYNITSITDLGTGNYTITIANDMANDDYVATVGSNQSGGANDTSSSADAYTVGTHTIQCRQNGGAIDIAEVTSLIHGDLA